MTMFATRPIGARSAKDAAIVAILAALISIASPLHPQALAQRVCALDDPDCNRQRIENTREDAVSRRSHRREDARSRLPQRYYGDQSSSSVVQPRNDNCDVAPVISGQDTRVVRSC